MVVTRYFVVVHIPRTGGNFIQTTCLEHLPPTWVVDTGLPSHAPYAAVPPEFKHLPAFCVVRNPWDWYVSWYEYTTMTGLKKTPQRQRSAAWRTAFDSGRNDFTTVVTNACTGNIDHELRSVMRRDDVDLYTAHYLALAARAVRDRRVDVGRFETLRQDFLGFLLRHAVPIDERFQRAITENPRTNASRHESYRQYYDEPLRRLVGRKADRIVREYGYSF